VLGLTFAGAVVVVAVGAAVAVAIAAVLLVEVAEAGRLSSSEGLLTNTIRLFMRGSSGSTFCCPILLFLASSSTEAEAEVELCARDPL